MFVIISELDPETANTVSELWYELRKACGLKAIYDVPTPHFTWFGADEISVSKAGPILSQISESTASITLRTFGFGVFSGATPVIYLPIVKTEEMFTIHRKIWDQVHPYSENPILYYSPSSWVPHITLALKDINPNNLPCAVSAIAFKPIELVMTINNLAIAIYKDEPPGEIVERYLFNE